MMIPLKLYIIDAHTAVYITSGGWSHAVDYNDVFIINDSGDDKLYVSEKYLKEEIDLWMYLKKLK